MKIVGHSSGITDKQRDNGYRVKYEKKTGRVSHHATGTKRFVAIDGEGINLENGDHIYGMLSIGNQPKWTIVNENGLEWEQILAHLYSYHLCHDNVGVAYVGFYLSYDFDRWLRTMPHSKVERLLTSEGRESRKSKSPNLHSRVLPVDMPGGWQINMLGKKMFEFRKRACHCDVFYCKCPGKGPWMRICDTGPFFQSSFLAAIDPSKWQTPIVSVAEYEFIKKNKENRPYATEFNEEMAHYNRLENEILQRLMAVLNAGFREMGIILAPGQWFGPGQAAQKWMKNECITKAEEVRKAVPQWFLEAARMSYYGGWFEIMMHGIIPGESYEYDINSAYPYIISSLPCLLHGNYDRGTGKPNRPTEYTLVYASVSSYEDSKKRKLHRIGTMPNRQYDDKIFRPIRSKGWYWLHEINAARKAGMITRCHIYEWMSYDPCDCLPPMRKVSSLYDLRIKVGKDTPLGKGCRLAYNSMYGKFAQSIGNPIFANPIWASLITAGCRTMICDAIATHPKGKEHVSMVATDAVFFCTSHPHLPISQKLGEWDYKARTNLTLFKPGVYWDDNTRRDISRNRKPTFKARGIASADFAPHIEEIDRRFKEWNTISPDLSSTPGMVEGWPYVEFVTGFSMISCLMAIRRGKWELAGKVEQSAKVAQNANPHDKRIGVWAERLDDGRTVWRSEPWLLPIDDCESVPYTKRFGMADPSSLERMEYYGITPDGTIPDVIRGSIGLW